MRVVIAVLCLLANPAMAGRLSEAEANDLRDEIATITSAFEKGDVEELIASSHPSLHDLAGGQQAYATITRDTVGQLRQTGIRFRSFELGTPTQTYPAGKEEVCFVPRVSVMEINGKTVKSTSFMIAVRTVGAKAWTYIDGAGLMRRPDLLYRLLPKLDRAIELPPNFVENQ